MQGCIPRHSAGGNTPRVLPATTTEGKTMTSNEAMLIEGAITTSREALWSPIYQLGRLGLKVDEGVQRTMLLEQLDSLDGRIAELRGLVVVSTLDDATGQGRR